jgi:oligosaccharide reducing-end xylanase
MPVTRGFLITLGVISLLLSDCSIPLKSTVPTGTPLPPTQPCISIFPIAIPVLIKPLESITYRNLFKEYLGKADVEVKEKLGAAWQQLFYGSDDFQRIYYPISADMAYVEDIGNSDVRTEGMSYGMMIAVQLDKKTEFDRMWNWAKTYMYQTDGTFKGYFAWHCSTDGKQLAANPASDGEEWFVTSLFLASARWGNGQEIYNYKQQAQAILDTMRSKSAEDNGIATDMFDLDKKQVVFVPSGRNSTFTDPSYQLPAYYELWAQWADKDNAF